MSGSSGAVCCAKHLACTICCRKNETPQWQTVCTTPRPLNTSQPELKKIITLLSPIGCDITISLGPILHYVVPIQPLAVIPNKSFVNQLLLKSFSHETWYLRKFCQFGKVINCSDTVYIHSGWARKQGKFSTNEKKTILNTTPVASIPTTGHVNYAYAVITP